MHGARCCALCTWGRVRVLTPHGCFEELDPTGRRQLPVAWTQLAACLQAWGAQQGCMFLLQARHECSMQTQLPTIRKPLPPMSQKREEKRQCQTMSADMK